MMSTSPVLGASSSWLSALAPPITVPAFLGLQQALAASSAFPTSSHDSSGLGTQQQLWERFRLGCLTLLFSDHLIFKVLFT